VGFGERLQPDGAAAESYGSGHGDAFATCGTKREVLNHEMAGAAKMREEKRAAR
jgi:hypothetical protein